MPGAFDMQFGREEDMREQRRGILMRVMDEGVVLL
jgi:hypothetical protein